MILDIHCIHGRNLQCVTVLVVYAVGLVPTLHDMSEELDEVGWDWLKFGLALGVPLFDLRKIEYHYGKANVELCMSAMLECWLKITPGACWQQVIAALEELDLIDLASHVKQKYLPEGVCVCVCQWFLNDNYTYVVLYVFIDIDMCVFTYCIYTNTVSTRTVPDTPSGATPTVQDVSASHDEHSKQGISVYDSCCSITSISKHKKDCIY